MTLTEDHIDYVRKDLGYRGIIVDGLNEELVDHICSAVEGKMQRGTRFIDAYQSVLKDFGYEKGLQRTQKLVLETTNTKAGTMLKNYFKVALRNHRKNGFYTLINVSGLAVGIAACMIITLFVINEISYDRHFANADRIYRVNSEIKFGEAHHLLASVPARVGDAMRETYPEIESMTRVRRMGWRYVHTSEQTDRTKENVAWVDSTFFKVFSLPVLEGNPDHAFTAPNQIAISKKMAAKYFPGTTAIGKTLVIDKEWNHVVIAVYDDIPTNTHFHFEMLMPVVELDEAKSVSVVGGGDFSTYLLLREGVAVTDLEAKFSGFIKQNVAPQLAAVLGNDFSMEKFNADGNRWSYTLLPLSSIHLYGNRVGEAETNGSIVYVYLFGAIAVFILAIACINFMNLSTARSSNRAKEVGVRKVMGSLRTHLVRQFLTESVTLTFGAIVLGVLLAWLLLPSFNELAQKQLVLPFRSISFYVVLCGAVVFVSLLAGLYPAFFLSAFKPAQVLKGATARSMKSSMIRSSLVVFQFVVSIFLIIATVAVNKQLDFIQEKNIGFNKEQVLVVREAQLLGSQGKAFKDELLKSSLIESATISGFLPVSNTWRSNETFWPEGVQPTGDGLNEMVAVQQWDVDEDYAATMGMKMVQGRFLNSLFASDSTAVVMNATAARQFNFGSDAIEKKIVTFNGSNPDGTPNISSLRVLTVIGVVEDFHFESMREGITPLVFKLDEANGNIAVRLKAADTEEAITIIKSVWARFVPDQAMVYSFLDEDFDSMYQSEVRLGQVFGIFAVLAIVIACLGLFALTAFTAEQRTKEIGIRKVLGASVNGIVVLLSKDFGKLIVIAFLMAAPIAWYAVKWWLESYQYKTTVGVTVYALAGGLAFSIALLTMGYQSVRAAMSDPVKSLRSE